MSERTVNQRPTRRRFLKGVLAAGGAAGAVALGETSSARVASPVAPSGTNEIATRKGYRETAHVRAYYEKARF